MSLENRSMLRSTFVYVFIGFLPVAANFLLAPVYTKFLLPEEYALVGLATLFQTFLTFFLSLSLDGAFSKLYFDYERRPALKNSILGTLLVAVIIASVVVTGILFLAGDRLFSLFFNSDIFRFTNFGYWVVIITFSNIIFTFFALLYRNEEKLKKFSLLNILFFFIPVTCTLAGLMFFKNGALSAITGRAIGSFAFIVVLLFMYFKKYRPVIRYKYFRIALKFALPIIPYQLMFAAFSNLDRFVLQKNFLPHDFGVYNFAVMVTGIVPVFLNALGNATNPRMYRELANNGNQELVRKYNYLNLFFSTGIICLCIGGVVPAMRIIINKDYSDAYMYIGTLFLSFIPYLHYLVYNVPLFYFGKTRTFPVIALLALLAGIAFDKFFIPLLGIWAVCFSLYIIRFVQALVAYYYIVKYRFDKLPYVQHSSLIFGSFVIILLYNAALAVHLRFNVLPIDLINLLPLTSFVVLSIFIYKPEMNLSLATLKSIRYLKLNRRILK